MPGGFPYLVMVQVASVGRLSTLAMSWAIRRRTSPLIIRQQTSFLNECNASLLPPAAPAVAAPPPAAADACMLLLMVLGAMLLLLLFALLMLLLFLYQQPLAVQDAWMAHPTVAAAAAFAVAAAAAAAAGCLISGRVLWCLLKRMALGEQPIRK